MRPIDYMSQMDQFLTTLNDSDMLSRGRQVSRFFDVSIVRWAGKRADLIYANAFAGLCTSTKEIEIVDEKRRSTYGDYYVPKLEEQMVRSCLTFRDIEELAQFELPTLTNPTQLGSREWTQIELSPGSLPRDPYMATAVVEILMFFALIYFGAYAREAVLSPTFPARASMFGAFATPPQTLLIFLLALWCPFFVSVGVAVTSHEWPLWVCSVLILYSVLFIHRVLHSKSYFAPLRIRFVGKTNAPTNDAD
jgi:hypothetical protein